METSNNKLIVGIPNFITLLNLFAGCLSIVLAFQGETLAASMLIFVGGVLDFLDGMAARMLKAYSELGKMLDSLADMVTFGLAPSVILFQMMKLAYFQTRPMAIFEIGSLLNLLVPSVAFVIALFSALRLAKFNIDTRQTDSFIGVPTPANAFFIASLPFVLSQHPGFAPYILNLYVLVTVTVVLSLLMVSEIPMLSLKLKSLSFSKNQMRYLLVAGSIIFLAVFRMSAVPLIFIFYVLLSLVESFLTKTKED